MMKKILKSTFLAALAMAATVLVSCNEEEETPEEVVAGFTQTIDTTTGTVTFVNTSENATNYAWDFGDDTNSELKDPVKTYTENGTYTVILTASNDDGSSDMAQADIMISTVVPDTEAPVITLLGDAEVIITTGDTYEDAGATANDNADGDITANIVVTGTVDASTVGVYTLSYNVSDAAGNAATEVKRTVNVLEKIRVEDGLLTNGDFEDGTANWTTNYGDNLPEIRSEGGNKYFYAEVSNSNPDESFAVSLQQVVEIISGESYILTFTASGSDRTLFAGIGLNEEPFGSNVKEEVSITSTATVFEIKLKAAGFGIPNSRVFFELNGADGVVVIDNVKLEVDPNPPTGDAPSTAAPDPTRDAAKVVSIFSDTYTDLTGINYDPNWGQPGHTLVNTTFDLGSGNSALAYPTFTYQGTDLGGNQDLSAMRILHVDIWVPEGTDRQVKVSPISATGVVEFLVPVTLTPGSWSSVDLPVGSFTGMTWDAIKEIKFDGQFNGDGSANTTPFDIYLDNIYFFDDGTTGGGGGTPGENLCVNGDFETGDLSGWTSFASENNGTWTVSDVQANGGTYSGLLKAEGAGSFPVVKQANLAAGTIAAGASVTVSFDMYGSVAGDGGVVFVELFSELAEGGTSKNEFILQPPNFPTATWTNYTVTTTLGSDVAGGATLQFKADCGGNANCVVEAYFDNVSLVVNN